MKLATSTTWTELLLLMIAFVLSMIIGIERQVRQKSAGCGRTRWSAPG
jgi:putative Mg2+ transporter-C (MgtC) family protein